MFKRMTALLLALSMLFSLSGCGKPKQDSTQGRTYASEQAMDVFEALEAVRDLKDFTFELQVSRVDAETGALGQTRYTASGAWYSSTKQASIQLRLPDESLLTTLTVDGANLYADIGTAADALKAKFQEQGAEEYAQDMDSARTRLNQDVVHFPLQEDPWTALETGRLAESRESLRALYNKVKQYNARRVTMEQRVGKLSLGLGDLQSTLLDIAGDLERNKTIYQGGLEQVLTGDFGLVLDEEGTDAQSVLDEKWAVYEETGEMLYELQEEGDYNGWTAKLLACGDAEHGYSLDLTTSFNEPMNYLLSVYPAQAEPVKVPDAFVELSEAAESTMLVYVDGKIYLREAGRQTESEKGEEGEELTAEELEEAMDGADESGVAVETAPMEDQPSLVTTSVYTSDGASRKVPLLASYDSLEGTGEEGAPTDVFQSSNGYVLEYVAAERRDLAKVAKENADMYAEDFRENWGYPTVTEPSQSILSANADAAMAGLAYHNVDVDQDVTVITGCLDVENSNEMLYFDLFVYSKSVTDKEISAIGDLLQVLGTELPVEIIKN